MRARPVVWAIGPRAPLAAARARPGLWAQGCSASAVSANRMFSRCGWQSSWSAQGSAVLSGEYAVLPAVLWRPGTCGEKGRCVQRFRVIQAILPTANGRRFSHASHRAGPSERPGRSRSARSSTPSATGAAADVPGGCCPTTFPIGEPSTATIGSGSAMGPGSGSKQPPARRGDRGQRSAIRRLTADR